MTNLRLDLLPILAGSALAISLSLGGCKKKQAPPPPPPPPPPVVERAPDPVDIAGLQQSMNIDPRVQFPEQFAPINPELARAILTFADAFIKGDDEAIRSHLDAAGAEALDEILAQGNWHDPVEKIELLRVTFLAEVDDAGNPTGPSSVALDLSMDALREQQAEFLQDVPPEMQEWAQQATEQQAEMLELMSSPDMQRQIQESMVQFQAALESEETFEEYLATLPPEFAEVIRGLGYENARRQLADVGMLSQLPQGSVVVFAIQQPGEAYRLRWDVAKSGDGYTFRPLDASEDVRARAAAFDGDPAIRVRSASLLLPEEIGEFDGEAPVDGELGPERENRNPRRTITPPSSPGAPGEGE